MNKTTKTVLISILVVILIGGGILLGMNLGKSSDNNPNIVGLEEAEDYTGNRDTYQGEKNTDTIDIPGFDVLNFKAGTTEQVVNLYNPEKNTCYFKMSILLSDGTLVWESKLVEPGKAVYELTLSQVLAVGVYEDTILKYECFAMNEEQTPLNGAETKFTLNVLE